MPRSCCPPTSRLLRTNILPRAAFAQPSCHDGHIKGSWAARQLASPGEHVGAGAEDDVRPHSSIPGKSSRIHDLAYRVGVSPSSLSGIQECYTKRVCASVSQRYTTDDVPCLCFSMSGAKGDTFTFSAVRSTAESYLLKCSETFLHTVHANFCRIRIVRWTRGRQSFHLVGFRWWRCSSASASSTSLCSAPVARSGRVGEDTALAGTLPAQRSRSVRHPLVSTATFSSVVDAVGGALRWRPAGVLFGATPRFVTPSLFSSIHSSYQNGEERSIAEER